MHCLQQQFNRVFRTTSAAWCLQPELPNLLRDPSGSSKAEQKGARGHASCHKQNAKVAECRGNQGNAQDNQQANKELTL